ncbi:MULTISPECIES: hypothetical protein [Streptomyces violaceusniger group]|uniref:AG1 protein n=4 Tax=Streptomyces violaceusniger group TaxID=2839105 RepID=A0ABS4MM40_9ACTN|nr:MULTISPECIES: hypothetical protein [Streptomyces violaceusniger group]MBP2060628.1 hypothetical protein [Streptomyces iranensis]
MSFEDEWAQIKSEAAQRQETHMRLNQVDGPGGTAPSPAAQKGDLSVKAKDLAAIGDAAFKLYQRLDKDGDHAQTTSATAAKDLKDDFDIGGALSEVVETWRTQVNSLLAACAHISNHLDYTKKAHAGDEHYIAASFSYETLDENFR